MDTFKLERSEWRRYFDVVTKYVRSSAVSVWVGGLDLGMQAEVEQLELLGLSYDSHDGELAIVFDALSHRIEPREIWVKLNDIGHLQCFEVIDKERRTQIVEVLPALPLPPPD
jgi:hypothetical protein